jgi:hypothetical protein
MINTIADKKMILRFLLPCRKTIHVCAFKVKDTPLKVLPITTKTPRGEKDKVIFLKRRTVIETIGKRRRLKPMMEI